MILSRKTRYIFLGIAGMLLAIAIAWSFLLSGGVGGRICREMSRYGYSLSPGELNVAGTWDNVSIRSLLNESDADGLVSLSKGAGFRSDIDAAGTVTIITVNVSDGQTLMIFLLDDNIELVFLDDGTVARAVG